MSEWGPCMCIGTVHAVFVDFGVPSSGKRRQTVSTTYHVVVVSAGTLPTCTYMGLARASGTQIRQIIPRKERRRHATPARSRGLGTRARASAATTAGAHPCTTLKSDTPRSRARKHDSQARVRGVHQQRSPRDGSRPFAQASQGSAGAERGTRQHSSKQHEAGAAQAIHQQQARTKHGVLGLGDEAQDRHQPMAREGRKRDSRAS